VSRGKSSGKATVNATYFVNDRMMARVKAKLTEQAKRVKQHDVRVGINEADGAQKIIKYTGEEGEATVAYVALAHEFGAGVPMRSWFRTWFDRNTERNRKQMKAAMQAEMRGDTTAVELLATRWAYEMRAWITTSEAGLAPLADSTKRQRKRMGLSEDPPLFAIGQIVACIRAEVDGKTVTM